MDGNATLQVKITDAGEPGTSDKIAITVWNKDGGLWFASKWNGTTTVEQILGGGNLKVHGGAVCAPTATKSIVAIPGLLKNPVSEAGLFNVIAYPNPTENQFTLVLKGGTDEKVRVVIYDVLGRQVKRIEGSNGQQFIRFGEDLKEGMYVVEVIQGTNRKVVKLLKLN